MKIAILGLGEAGSHFANDLVKMGIEVSGWDPDLQKELYPKVQFAASNSDAVSGADIVFSVNLTAVSKEVAEEVLPSLKKGTIYCEMNTSAPVTKQEVARILQAAEVLPVDVAIMAPVPGRGIKVPLLASGEGAMALAEKLRPYSLNLSVLSDEMGAAASRKLLRSIIYKGVAAVICEGMEAGKHFGLEAYMREQIHSIIGKDDDLIDRFISGSRTHAKRRKHEMEAVVKMLSEEQLSAIMCAGAVENLNRYWD